MSRLIQVTRHVILFAWFESLNNNFFIELLMKKELQALTLVGPTRENLVQDPLALAVQHLHNPLYMKRNGRW